MRTVLMLLCLAGLASGCSNASAIGGDPVGDKALVERAATIAVGGADSFCEPVSNGYGGYWSCSGIDCTVTLGVDPGDGGGSADYYYCYPHNYCTDVEGCGDPPGDEYCIVGHSRRLALDSARTANLPGNGAGQRFSCPDYDEG